MRRGSGGGRVFEVGTGEHLTSYAATEVVPEDAGSRITVEFGADFYRSQISNVDPETGQVTCKLPPGPGKMPGLDQDWVASNEARTTFWRADYLGDLRFKLRGEPVTADDFEPEGVLRLWEYGVGDTVRRSTRVSVRRVGDGLFEAKLDVDATIGLKAKAVAASMDRERWRAAAGTRKGVWFHVEVGASEAAGGPVYLRIQ